MDTKKYLSIIIPIVCSMLIILSVLWIIYLYTRSVNTSPEVRRVRITPNKASGSRGQSINFTASGVLDKDPPIQPYMPAMMSTPPYFKDNYPIPTSWAVTGGVEGTTIERGILKIGKLETAKKLTVTASFTLDSRKSAKVTVTVQNPANIHIGPGGGIVFYDKGKYTDGWRYLEAAPISKEFQAIWGLYDIACFGTSEGIGTGKANTTAIIELLEKMGDQRKATQLCAMLSINGLNDWFLPSKDELHEMFKFNKMNDEDLGDFGNKMYWSSSVYSGDTSFATWYQHFDSGIQNYSRWVMPPPLRELPDVVVPPQYAPSHIMDMVDKDNMPARPEPASPSISRKSELYVRAVRAF